MAPIKPFHGASRVITPLISPKTFWKNSLFSSTKYLMVIATAHNITFLEVPSYGDPRRNVDLTCHYINDKGNPPLHSVKWYRNNNEIFRYMPGQQPETRTFNTTAGGVTRGDCNKHSCSISVVLPKKYNTRISYMCEVSTEGPRFAVVKQTKNLTVAVALNQDPVITGLPSSVSFGEDVLVNCTTAPAMPPANIVWYVDGKRERFEPWVVDNTEVTEADSDGLRRSWRPLKIKITSGRFVSLRCEAMQPTHPPYMRSTNASLTVARSPHLGMFTASGSSNAKAVLIPVICAAVHIFSKSALSDV
ncbi:uncharacterized protein [Choristoneura fumiferana]|uniref:uncharacterized protein n=1 Tax=Choristoneura fumiferana TaxID=7141 RepID=UPI003D157CC4